MCDDGYSWGEGEQSEGKCLDIPFDPKHIDKHFKNISIRPYHTGELFVLYDECCDVAEIFYMGKGSWHVIIDNFPAPRRNYSTNFPIKTVDEFIIEMKRINLNFEKI